MNMTKVFSVLFAILGVLLIVATVALSILALDAPVQLLGTAEQAEQVTKSCMEAIAKGDYDAAGSLMLGTPSLQPQQKPEGALSGLLWDAYMDSISYEFTGECIASDSGLTRSVTITALDIPGVMQVLKERSEALLKQRAAETDTDIVLDENDQYREEFAMGVLCDGAADILEEGGHTVSWDITLNLVHQDGQWWILPEQALIDILSGGMGG